MKIFLLFLCSLFYFSDLQAQTTESIALPNLFAIDKIYLRSGASDTLHSIALTSNDGNNQVIISSGHVGNTLVYRKQYLFQEKKVVHHQDFGQWSGLVCADKAGKGKLLLIKSDNQGRLSDTVQLESEERKLVSLLSAKDQLIWLSMPDKATLFFNAYSPAKGVISKKIASADAWLLNRLWKDGALAFGANPSLPSLFLSSMPIKFFHFGDQYILLHDRGLYEELHTKVLLFEPSQAKVEEYILPKMYAGYTQACSFFLNGKVYRALARNKDIQLQSFDLKEVKPLGEFHVAGDFQYQQHPLRFTSRQLAKSSAATGLLEEKDAYRKTIRRMPGALALVPQLLPDGSLQLNYGRYYEEKTIIMVSPLSVLSMAVLTSSVLISSLSNKNKGIENYFSINFPDPSLRECTTNEALSTLNQFDITYFNTCVTNKRLDFVDYYMLGGEPCLGYATKKDKNILHFIPLTSSLVLSAK